MNRPAKIVISCSVVILTILFVYCLLLLVRTDIDVKNPVRSAEQDQVTSLPGLDWVPAFKHYSGYLNADDRAPGHKFAHYWFVESQSDIPALDPLVVWLGSGEAGCSNMIGLLTELGPFRIEANQSISLNPHAWNKRANLLFMDSPTDIGYSYSSDPTGNVAAKQNYRSLKSFLSKFAHLRENPLYLAGRFSAGVYLPLLAEFINEDPQMNLVGIAIGNGYLDMASNDVAIFMSAFNRGFLSEATSYELSDKCCNGQAVNLGCNFWPPASQQCMEAMDSAASQIFNIGMNIYNVNRPCEGQAKDRPTPNEFTRRLFGFNEARHSTNNSGLVADSSGDDTDSSVSYDPLCNDYQVLKSFMNNPEVRAALHVPKALDKSYMACSKTMIGIFDMRYPTRPGGMMDQVLNLLESSKKLHFLFYSGDADIACPLLGNRWFVENLGAKAKKDYAPWTFKNQVAGFIMEFERVVYLTVKGAGQMVASDKPAEALIMFEMFISIANKETD